MDFEFSDRTRKYLAATAEFIRDEIRPREFEYCQSLVREPGTVPPLVEVLKRRARDEGLWNLFLPDPVLGAGLSHLEYAPVAESTGQAMPLAPEVFNCNAPDSGNAEVLHRFGTAEQKRRWMEPLLAGETRSAFCMTEPDVASADVANIAARADIVGNEVVLNGTKSWVTGIGHPRCEFVIFMGLTDPGAHKYERHSMVLVPLGTAGVEVGRLLPVFGYLDEPYGHGVVNFRDVRLPVDSIIAAPGCGFEIAQGRLGPSRVHHCARLIGLAERALELACVRVVSRTAFGKPLASLGGTRERIAKARIAIDQARLLVWHAAWKLDTTGVAGARGEISQVKASVPAMAADVIDMAIQMHGGAGVSDELPLAVAYSTARGLRIADGPDEAHLALVGREELRAYRNEHV